MERERERDVSAIGGIFCEIDFQDAHTMGVSATEACGFILACLNYFL